VGNGTFNLSEFYRQMGIKNPEPSIREFVQPVVNVGDFGAMTPKHEPPTYFGGGSVSLVAAQYPIIQITSLAPGGSRFIYWQYSSELKMGIAPRVPALVVVPDRGPLSNDASQVIVESGNAVANPLAGEHPYVRANHNATTFPFYIPPGQTFVIADDVVGGAINRWAMTVCDIVASQPPPV